MRILVTGATGSVGGPLCRELAARGCDVVALARHEPRRAPAGVRFLPGDIRDAEAVDAAVKGADAVVHLAWLVASARTAAEAEATNVTGTGHVLAAMGRHDVERLVFASSVMAYGSAAGAGPYREDSPLRADPRFWYGHHKVVVERMIAESGIPAVVARTAPVVGRAVRNVVTDQFAGPALVGLAGQETRWQFVHSEDVTSFLADSVTGPRTGVVNLAADGALDLDRVGELLGKRVVRLPYGAAVAMVKALWAGRLGDVDPAALEALRHLPIADTRRLREEFGFRCAWSNEEAVLDTRRSLRAYWHFGRFDLPRPSTLPYPEPGWRPDMSPWPGRPLSPVGPADLRGEFDDEIDPTMGDFTATNVAEAFPGPMTPLTLEHHLLGLRTGTEVTARLLGLDGWLAHEAQSRCVASFAHHIYLSVSFVREVFQRMPGSSPEEADAQYCGIPLSEGYRRPRITLPEVRNALRLLRRGGIAMARYGESEQWLLREAARLTLPTERLAELTDAELRARVRLLWDTAIDGEVINVNAALVGGAALSAAERKAGGHGVTAGGLASSKALEGVQRAAAIVRRDARAAAVLAEHRHDPDAFDRIGAASPELHRCLVSLLATVGHRGPGEFELANPTFSDRPVLLLDAVHGAAQGPARHAQAPAPRGVTERMAASALQRREHIRDALVRVCHQLRLALRELGSRAVRAGALRDPGDVVYLTYDQLFPLPPDAADIAARRRAERERLARLVMPPVIHADWQPVSPPPTRRTELTGNGVSPGVTRGRVRVLTDCGDGLEPGEILVCRLTDVGWTPLFASAAAVVTEIGGTMSHTAVVAREFGIPAVVSVDGATHHLSDGQLVEVDGTAGRVTILDG